MSDFGCARAEGVGVVAGSFIAEEVNKARNRGWAGRKALSSIKYCICGKEQIKTVMHNSPLRTGVREMLESAGAT